MARAQRLRHRFEIEGALGHEDRVGAGCDAGIGRDPPFRATHHFDDHDPVVGLGRRRDPVERIGDDLHGRVEAEREIGGRDVVVDRLRHADDEKALRAEPQRRTQSAVASDYDEPADPVCLERGTEARKTVAVNVGIVPRRAQDRAAALEDAAHVVAASGAVTSPASDPAIRCESRPPLGHAARCARRPRGSRR
jgi:hypothetical protein